MDLNKFARRAYSSALKRGKITDGADVLVSNFEMSNGLSSECSEVLKASEDVRSDHLPEYSEVAEELADVIIVGMTELYRRGVDVEKVLHEKMKYNERRSD